MKIIKEDEKITVFCTVCSKEIELYYKEYIRNAQPVSYFCSPSCSSIFNEGSMRITERQITEWLDL